MKVIVASALAAAVPMFLVSTLMILDGFGVVSHEVAFPLVTNILHGMEIALPILCVAVVATLIRHVSRN